MFVANQCIYEGGPAVFLARNLLHITYPWLYFSDNTICSGGSSFRESKEKQDISQHLVTVYPNPAKDKISFALAELNGSTSVEIFDLAGREIISKKMSDYVTEVNLQTMSQGFYTFIVRVNSVPLQHGKFNVIK